MSYCSIVTFADGKADKEIDFKNAWGGGARIWTAIYDTFLKDPLKEYDSWLSSSAPGSGDDRLWAVAQDTSKPEFLRAVHAGTFDHAVIGKEHFNMHADHLDTFRDAYLCGGVCHLAAWSAFLRTCKADFVGFWITSVCENPWMIYDDAADDYLPYDMSKADKHFEVYEWLRSTNGKENATCGEKP